jgi:hypothetical protein
VCIYMSFIIFLLDLFSFFLREKIYMIKYGGSYDCMVVGCIISMQSVCIMTNVLSLNLPRWGLLATTLCDKVCQWLAAGYHGGQFYW